jgi:tRNA nucleotidyltransferase/poly(A) polymerase
MSLPLHARQARRLRPGKPTATLSERFLRQSVAKGIDGMSHQYADAQNEGRSYNSRQHKRSPRSKRIKEDEHMHSQKNSKIRRDLTETRCALATATWLQHPERLAGEIGPDLFAPPLGSHHERVTAYAGSDAGQD